MMRRLTATMICLATLASLSGCLERRIKITSEPSGALVYLNDVEVGRTPVEVEFTYYGTYDVRLRKEGFSPLATKAEAKAPIYEYPVIDLIAEALPTRIETVIDWHFELQPSVNDVDGVLARARAMRTEVGFELGRTSQPGEGEGEGLRIEDGEEQAETPQDLPPILPQRDDDG